MFIIKKSIESKIKLTPKTAYLAGAIIGDGNLSNSLKSKNDKSKDYRISFEASDQEYVDYILEIIKSIILTKTESKDVYRNNRAPKRYFHVRNKELFIFLSDKMEIPKGKKSSIVALPATILSADNEIKKSFLAGYFDTDGGFRGNTLGFTTASIKLQDGISQLLQEQNINHMNESWFNKRYHKDFYGIQIRKSEIDKFLKILPLQNKEKFDRIKKRFAVSK